MDTHLIDQITPFNFGSAGKQLFGLYHTPDPAQERDMGVVLCNPWGQEYVRAHRAISQLGLRLARQGFPTLRFDYFGSGDSSGDDNEGSLAQWQADIRAAIQELKRRARIESVFLAGLRLGATLAALVASGREDVEGLVLWEPAVTGMEYVQDLQTWHEEKSFYFLNKVNDVNTQPALLGFGLHNTLLDDLNTLDLLAMKRKPAPRILIIENAQSPGTTRPSIASLRSHFETLGARMDYALVESFKMWAEDPDKGLVPHQVLETAISWIAREAA